MDRLASELHDQGKYDEAEPLYRETLEVRRETRGNRHPSTLLSIGNLGRLMYAKGDLAATEPLYREALEVQRETRGNWHPSTLDSIHNLGALLVEKGKYEEAEPLCSEVLQAWRETLGNWHPNTLIAYRLYWLLPFKLAEKLYGPPLRWLCGARRFAVGTLVRLFGRRRASVAPAVDCS